MDGKLAPFWSWVLVMTWFVFAWGVTHYSHETPAHKRERRAKEAKEKN